MINKIEIDPIFDTTVGKWVVAKHSKVVIEEDLEMLQEIKCHYYENDNGVIGEPTLDHISALEVPDTEKSRLRAMYQDFKFSRSTRGRFVTLTGKPIEITDPQTGEALPNLTEGVDYISERTMWQNIGLINGIDKIAGNVYELIKANILKMRDNNLSIE